MIDAAILTTLIPGSVWARERRQGGPAHSTVLCVTNQSLTGAKQEEYPPQVVFITEKGRICNQGVEQFLNRRTYVTINGKVDAMFAGIVDAALETDEEGNADLFESIELPTNAEGEGKSDELTLVNDSSPFQYGAAGELANKLADCFSRYTEVFTGEGYQSSLSFMMDDLTTEELEAAFKGDVGFSVTYQVGATEITTEVPAGTWTLLPTQLEVGSSRNAYARINLAVTAKEITGDVEVSGQVEATQATTVVPEAVEVATSVAVTPTVTTTTEQAPV